MAIPAVLYGAAVAHGWGLPADSLAIASGPARPLSLGWWLAIGRHAPFLAANLVFLLNVDVLFWLVFLAQGSTWVGHGLEEEEGGLGGGGGGGGGVRGRGGEAANGAWGRRVNGRKAVEGDKRA